MPVSEADWVTRKALMLSAARAEKMRLSTPTSPTIEVPLRVSRQMSSIEDMPQIRRLSSFVRRLRMVVPGADGLNVFLTIIGISLRQTA